MTIDWKNALEAELSALRTQAVADAAEIERLKAQRDALLTDLRTATEVGDRATPDDVVGVVKAMWEELRWLLKQADALKAQNAELLAAQQWQPIESAPRDGADFLVDYDGVTIARWQPDGSPFPWIFLDTDDGKFIFNRFRESVDGLVWRPKPLGWEAIAKARGDELWVQS